MKNGKEGIRQAVIDMDGLAACNRRVQPPHAKTCVIETEHSIVEDKPLRGAVNRFISNRGTEYDKI